ncbi:transcriptional regulator [Modestobacter sp. I12A-02628]|uniref:AfsR/SARP family transcriptional regulator n=1 Tax=Goekera deserti TaxID=2497753 RepID=A0A7K3WDM3_9ACTN|nr:AfsR/SARP family transcriptional regulator [Goekera deserti]MPQ97197.1 transcriptional regulator [Goekera deserti]NDI46485.1 transcriptional regulator [Goekera deserti]NEL54581.1 AfsR/SARP family transcriptional regulator [Goekera deserti]
MEIKLLGPLVLSDGSKSLVLRASKVGLVLALLLARRNELVSVDSLIDELWGDDPPRSALTTLQTYVYHLRKMLHAELGVPRPEDVLVTSPPGYLLAVDEQAVDVGAFVQLFRRGSAHMGRGEHQQAETCLGEALALWRGPAFAGIPTGPGLRGHISYLQEMRLAALGLHIQAQQELARHAELIPQLRSLVAEYPLHEGFHAHLIEALYTCGRRAEALQAYQTLWRVLDTELGVEPAPDVQRLHQQVLLGDREVLAHVAAG